MKPGHRLGDWVVLDALGQGAMGSVVLCHPVDEPEARVAVKVLESSTHIQYADRRFAREAELLAQINHPGVARFIDFRDGDPMLLVMEYVEGTSLLPYVRTHALSVGQSVEICEQVARALAYLHERGIWHRDVKPANILLDHRGRPKLVDFGIALDPNATRLTAQGFFMGSLAYVPPESLLEDDQSTPRRWDVYSLGVVLYELLTGKLAFSSKGQRNANLVIEQKTRMPYLDPGDRFDDLVRGVVQDATAADPEYRIASPEALAERLADLMLRFPSEGTPKLPDDLASALSSLPTPGPPPMRKNRRPRRPTQTLQDSAEPPPARTPVNRSDIAVLAGIVLVIAVVSALVALAIVS